MNPAKPIELKKQQGTARMDRIPKNPIKSKYLVKVPKCPSFISSDIGKKIWKRVCEIMISEKRLSEPDLFVIESYVNAYEMWHMAKLKLNELQHEVVSVSTNKFGAEYETASKWNKLCIEWGENKDKLANDLGFTPRVKGSINALGNQQSSNPLKDLLASMN